MNGAVLDCWWQAKENATSSQIQLPQIQIKLRLRLDMPRRGRERGRNAPHPSLSAKRNLGFLGKERAGFAGRDLFKQPFLIPGCRCIRDAARCLRSLLQADARKSNRGHVVDDSLQPCSLFLVGRLSQRLTKARNNHVAHGLQLFGRALALGELGRPQAIDALRQPLWFRLLNGQ